MESTTQKTSVVVSLLILAGFTLMALPLSVFSQEVAATTPNEDLLTQTAEPGIASVVAYTTEQLEGETVIGDFVVGPGKAELSLEPGESQTIEMIVTNRMGELKTFKFEVEDAVGTNDADIPVVLLGEDRGPYTLKDYISIPNMEFDLAHMERARIPVTVSLPADAEAGGRYGSVLVSTVSRDAELDSVSGAAPASAIISRVGTLFFVTTPGSTDISGELVSFQTIPDNSLFLEGPIDFGLVYENTGAVHLGPYGEISITNMSGNEIDVVELDPWFALPQSLRTREVSWSKEVLIGRYKATAYVNRGYDDVVDEIAVTFWVLPWKLLLTVFGCLLFAILLIRFVATRFEFKRK